MKSPFLPVMILLMATLVGVIHWKVKPEPTEREFQDAGWGMNRRAAWQGKFAPDFELKTTQGETFKLSENIGKKVMVINFFATWCGPCRDEMPELNEYYNAHKSQDFILLAVDAEEKPDAVEGFWKELKLDFPVGIDEGAIRKQYGVSAYPTTVLVGVDGKVQLYEVGGLGNAEVAFDSLLKMNRQITKSGIAISAEEYKKQVTKQPPIPGPVPPPPPKEESIKLDERGKRIAAHMDCPCGCDNRVADCTCNTSTKIKKALAAEKFEKQTDAQIMMALNKRYCMGSM
ncbi:MAG: redoxin domain-containing protein [Terriglobia bacterium]